MKHILGVDDHPLIRMILGKIVSKLPYPVTFYEAGGFSEAQILLERQVMDLVILDLSIPQGLDADMIECLRAIQHQVPILILSGRDEQVHAPYYINQGANGYVSKRDDEQEIRKAIMMVLEGKSYLKDEIKQLILYSLVENNVFSFNPIQSLTLREKQIMKFFLRGQSVKDTADELGLKMSTISTHKVKIYEKLKVQNLLELAKIIELHHDELHINIEDHHHRKN